MHINRLLFALKKRLFWLDDAVVVSFPKSGRTWLRVMLDYYGIFLHYTHAGSDHRYHKLPEQLSTRTSRYINKRILLMIRDPRDTVLSGFFHATKRINIFDGNLQEFIRDQRYGIDKIIKFNLMWIESNDRIHDFSILQYEDLHKDIEDELRRVIKFISRKIPDDKTLTKAIRHGSFENMKNMEISKKGTNFYGKALSPANPADPESFKTRKGKIGDWQNHFTPEDKAFADKILEKHNYFDVISEKIHKLKY